MTIEVRQLLIRSSVGGAPARAPTPALPAPQLERLKDEILAECKAWLADRLQAASER
jgi:Family of unknown function (DUF5908)